MDNGSSHDEQQLAAQTIVTLSRGSMSKRSYRSSLVALTVARIPRTQPANPNLIAILVAAGSLAKRAKKRASVSTDAAVADEILLLPDLREASPLIAIL